MKSKNISKWKLIIFDIIQINKKNVSNYKLIERKRILK